jgi:insulysin
MVEMFRHYISPSSPARAKLAIHLYAKGVSSDSSPSDTPVLTVPKMTQIVEKGISMLKLGSSVEKATEGDNSAADPADEKSQNIYIIEDVREYKSRLAVTPGPQPMKDLSEFEDIDAKL